MLICCLVLWRQQTRQAAKHANPSTRERWSAIQGVLRIHCPNNRHASEHECNVNFPSAVFFRHNGSLPTWLVTLGTLGTSRRARIELPEVGPTNAVASWRQQHSIPPGRRILAAHALDSNAAKESLLTGVIARIMGRFQNHPNGRGQSRTDDATRALGGNNHVQ